MRHHQLFAKKSICFFGVEKVEYLEHFISKEGVATYPDKIEAVKTWPTPKFVKQLRSFLGLASYYRRFVRGYETVAKPLTNLLKKDNFNWLDEATTVFEKLKNLLINDLVLALPDFCKEFIVEVDASRRGISAVLMQDKHPIVFISWSLNLQQQAISTYEKELLVVLYAVQK